MNTYYELEFIGLESHTLFSILTISYELSVCDIFIIRI